MAKENDHQSLHATHGVAGIIEMLIYPAFPNLFERFLPGQVTKNFSFVNQTNPLNICRNTDRKLHTLQHLTTIHQKMLVDIHRSPVKSIGTTTTPSITSVPASDWVMISGWILVFLVEYRFDNDYVIMCLQEGTHLCWIFIFNHHHLYKFKKHLSHGTPQLFSLQNPRRRGLRDLIIAGKRLKVFWKFQILSVLTSCCGNLHKIRYHKTHLFYFRIRSNQSVFNPPIHHVGKVENVPGLCNQLPPSLLKHIFLEILSWYLIPKFQLCHVVHFFPISTQHSEKFDTNTRQIRMGSQVPLRTGGLQSISALRTPWSSIHEWSIDAPVEGGFPLNVVI